MPTPEWLAEQFEAAPGALARGGVSDARVGERSRGCGPGELDSARPDRCQRRREPARLADDRRRARVPGHVADADIAPGGSLGRARARSGHHSRRRGSGVRRDARRLGRTRAPRCARDPRAGGAARLRAARRVRHDVRRDRADRRSLARCGASAREPRAASRPEQSPERRPRPRISSGVSSTRSWLPPTRATSSGWSPCSIRISCCGLMAVRSRACRGSCEAPSAVAAQAATFSKIGSVQSACPRERQARARVASSRRPGVFRGRLHDCRREDRRDGHPGRPRASQPTRSVGHRRLNGHVVHERQFKAWARADRSGSGSRRDPSAPCLRGPWKTRRPPRSARGLDP